MVRLPMTFVAHLEMATHSTNWPIPTTHSRIFLTFWPVTRPRSLTLDLQCDSVQLRWLWGWAVWRCCKWSECRSWGLWVLTPWKYVGRVRVCFAPLKMSHSFIQKLLLDNSASFTLSRMKDFCKKWKVKLIFRGAWNSLMAWPDWPTVTAHSLRQIYATAGDPGSEVRHCGGHVESGLHRGRAGHWTAVVRRRRRGRPAE